MTPLPDDRTARARIRDEALRLFGDRGADAVTVRDIASAAGVSAALIVRHYGSKDGLREAVDDYVAQVFAAMLDEVTGASAPDPFAAASLPSLADVVVGHLPGGSAVPAYLGRMLIDGGPAGSALFARLHEVSRVALDQLAGVGHAAPGADPDVRAAFLLINDLALLMLRPRLREVLGVDPLSAEGLRRWGAEVQSVYTSGLTGESSNDPTPTHR